MQKPKPNELFLLNFVKEQTGATGNVQFENLIQDDELFELITKTIDVPQNVQSLYDKQADPEVKCG